RLDVVFKNFPLTESHPHAMAAAQAAAAQGRFWEMHDQLFEHPQALGADDLMQYAEAIGLDLDRFDVDFSNHETLARIERDINQGMQNGIDATPAFFINGERYEGALDEASLRRALEHPVRTRDL